MEAKFSRRLHRLRIDGRPGQLRTIPIALSILSNGVRKLAFHLFDLARWQLLVVGKEEEEKKKQATRNFIFSYPHPLVILLFVLPLIINLFSCSVLLISVSSRFAVSSPMVRTKPETSSKSFDGPYSRIVKRTSRRRWRRRLGRRKVGQLSANESNRPSRSQRFIPGREPSLIYDAGNRRNGSRLVWFPLIDRSERIINVDSPELWLVLRITHGRGEGSTYWLEIFSFVLHFEMIRCAISRFRGISSWTSYG